MILTSLLAFLSLFFSSSLSASCFPLRFGSLIYVNKVFFVLFYLLTFCVRTRVKKDGSRAFSYLDCYKRTLAHARKRARKGGEPQWVSRRTHACTHTRTSSAALPGETAVLRWMVIDVDGTPLRMNVTDC
uniref:Secreted peptide n=1 Tax=Anopheles braziliensis TaxID=58242 RepID=A0A2M3ZL31_9DIPT